MRSVFLKLLLVVLAFALYGCATPAGMKWHKSGHSPASTNADVEYCKTSTALWWPFDDLNRCMHRRGYRLIGASEMTNDPASGKVVRSVDQEEIYRKLNEIKHLRDDGIISEEEYESMRIKLLSNY